MLSNSCCEVLNPKSFYLGTLGKQLIGSILNLHAYEAKCLSKAVLFLIYFLFSEESFSLLTGSLELVWSWL